MVGMALDFGGACIAVRTSWGRVSGTLLGEGDQSGIVWGTGEMEYKTAEQRKVLRRYLPINVDQDFRTCYWGERSRSP